MTFIIGFAAIVFLLLTIDFWLPIVVGLSIIGIVLGIILGIILVLIYIFNLGAGTTILTVILIAGVGCVIYYILKN